MKHINTEYEKHSWQVVIFCIIAYTTIYIGKKTLSVCLDDMITEGVCDKISGGTIGTCFLACYAIGQLICGWLGDKINPRFMICGGLLSAGIMNVIMSALSNPIPLIIVWSLCGFACSMLWPSIIRAIASWTTPHIRMEAGASISITIPAGTILCYAICALMLEFFGWRAAFFACGSVLCIMAVVLFFLFGSLRDHISQSEHKSEEKSDNTVHAPIHILCFGLIMAAVGIIFNGMIKDGLDFWIPTVLNEKFISDSAVVSTICTILPIINIVGVFISKYIFAKFKLCELDVCSIMFGVSATAIGFVVLFMRTSQSGFMAAMTVTILLAISSAAMLGANNMLLTFIPLHFGKIGRASSITGILNCFSYAAAAASGVAVGSVSENFGWESVFILFTIAALLGMIFSFAGRSSMKKKAYELDNYKAD